MAAFSSYQLAPQKRQSLRPGRQGPGVLPGQHPPLALQPVLSPAVSEPPGRAQVRAGTQCQLWPRQSSHSCGGQTPRPQRAPAEPLTVMTGRRRGCARPRTDLAQEDVGLHLHLPLPPQHVNLGGRVEGKEGETRSRRESNGAHH